MRHISLLASISIAAIIVASAPTAWAQHAGTAASVMAGRANANAGQVRGAIADTANLSPLTDGTPPETTPTDKPSGRQQLVPGKVNSEAYDPALSYPSGRVPLATIDPNTQPNPFVHSTPGINNYYGPYAAPAPLPAFGASPPPAFAPHAPAFSRGR